MPRQQQALSIVNPLNFSGVNFATSFSKSYKMKMTNNYPLYESCIKACLRCADACNHCASSCTQEKDIKMMARCIQLDMECATICYASAQLMSLGSDFAKAVCQICADICWLCNEECSKHQTDHCQECAKMCKLCAEECQKMAA
jgi:hypothetical protein